MATAEIKKPEYINNLLSPVIQEQLGFHVNVGTPDMKVERIGCLRWMLIARSKVLKTMLLESELKVGDEMNVTDLKPDTFKDFLIFAYGHDHTETLGFVESLELLGAADKYGVEDLKSRLAGLITRKVTVKNVCTVLQHGPVCETALPLWERITEVIQTKTKELFDQPQFLTLDSNAVSHILQQDSLSVAEIGVWRAAVSWARFQLTGDAVTSSPDVMRKTMDPLLRYTRLCSVPQMDLSKEVVPSHILNEKELLEILVSINTQVESSKLGDVCSSLRKRGMKSSSDSPVKFYSLKGLTAISHYNIKTKLSMFDILVKESNLELVSGVVCSNLAPWDEPLPKDLTYQCTGRITIRKVNYNTDASHDILYEIPFNETVSFNSIVELKMQTSSGANVVLLANTKYCIWVAFAASHRMFQLGTTPGCREKDFVMNNFTLNGDCYYHHFMRLKYRVQN